MANHQNKLFFPTLWAIGGVSLIWSAIETKDYFVWAFELFPGTIGISVLLFTYRRYQFSNLVYVVVCTSYIFLCIGAKYTYANMPLFNWLKETLDLSRNHFDRVGHCVQGFLPAVMLREFFIRQRGFPRGKVLAFITITICVGLSAFYEILEMWIVLLFYPNEGPEWLGFQGDPWDTQWDMLMAFLGAAIAYLTLRRAHDRSIEELKKRDLKS